MDICDIGVYDQVCYTGKTCKADRGSALVHIISLQVCHPNLLLTYSYQLY